MTKPTKPTAATVPLPLTPFVPNQIWIKEYPVRYSGCSFHGRMTVVKMQNGKVLIHSPCAIDDTTKEEIEEIGPVSVIIAPGTYHYFHVQSCQKAFPTAKTFLCPGIEVKRPDIKYDGLLTDTPEPEWSNDFDQVLLRGNKLIWEVAFFHKPTSTLLLVDLIELIGDETPGTNWLLRFFWKYVMFMWNIPKPAPEYQMGWKRDKSEARTCLKKIVNEWDFDKIILAHGETIQQNAKEVAKQAWKNVLQEV